MRTRNAGHDMKRDAEEAPKPVRHDVFLIHDPPDGGKGSRLERFRVNKDTGAFEDEAPGKATQVDPLDDGYRAVMNVGTMGGSAADDPARGPILSALPLHPVPAASNGTTCYLVNAQNLNYTTTWTSQVWNDGPGAAEAEGSAQPDCFSLLIASPSGKVYYLEKKVGRNQEPIPLDDEGSFIFREVVELGLESEIWMQLRNGCVVGNVMFENRPGASSTQDKVVPLVNIDSLTPKHKPVSS